MADGTVAEPRVEARQWLTLAIVLCGSFLTFFDAFVVNVAVPTLQRELRASFAQVQFVIAGYSLSYAVALVTGGRLGDIFGRKRMFMLGMAGFIAASALCGLAPSAPVLIGARIAQGLAGAVMTPQVLAIIQVTFAPESRGRALAAFGMVAAFTSLAGLVLGGLLIKTDLFGLSWRFVFLVNLPVGLVALGAAALLLTESRSATALRLDVGGVGLITLALLLLVYPLVQGRDAGWPWWAWLSLLAALPALGLFLWYERRVTARGGSPLVVLRLFRQRAFIAGLLVALPSSASVSSYTFALALYLQLGLHYSPLAAGLTLAPSSGGFLIAALVGVRLGRRLGNRLIAFAVTLSMAAWATIGAIVLLDVETPLRLPLGLAIGVSGFSVGSTTPRLIGAVLAGIDRDDAGSASGVLTTCQQIGSALGVALIGVIFFGFLAGNAPSVGSTVAPDLARQLAATPLDAERAAATVGDFRVCAEDRARSHDPALTPASCRVPTLLSVDPLVKAAVEGALRRANARNYGQAYAVSMIASVGFLVVALVGACNLPGVWRAGAVTVRRWRIPTRPASAD
ncbi:MAG: MFS transporter [Thermomicrobiales bacterium]